MEYLLGRAVASDVSQRDAAEWPPHPSRLFSALVDALADVRVDSSDEHARCEAALRWLEKLPAPEIAASIDDDVSCRTMVKHWVPINDETVERLRSAPLVEQRKRQERFFPAIIPAKPVVTFIWPSVEPENEHARALDRLVERVPYLGHSSSLVRMTRRSDAPPPTLAPSLDGNHILRVPGPGRLDRLNAVHQLRKSDTLVQPPKGREVAYGRIRPARPYGPYGAARIVTVGGVTLGLEHMASLIVRYREALLSLLGDNAPEVLTGHSGRGIPAARTHIAYVPLANIDHEFADGTIKGIAVVLPREIADDELLRLDVAMSRLRTLHFGSLGNIAVGARHREDGRRSLDFRRYARAATTWVSVTPVALSLHPKPKKGLSEEQVVLKDLARLGLPQPVELYLQDVAFLRGAPRARDVLRRGVSSVRGRLLRHVHVRFPCEVEGPLLLGAARHMGLGLLLPRGNS
ncbi:type I-U CRISPR-associated protein Csb2 [Pendulispora albinea]|uniref:Type I-U CRISPR-associated protein Csb2 n=1 Tax=Pendulispora albinea TaxID=2741071 RepID=A0ABZ2MCD3_9BACT